MIIIEIAEIPIFITEYMDSGKCDLESQLSKFKNLVTSKQADNINISNDIMTLVYNLEESDYEIRYFASFYIEASKLDDTLECKYENDLNMSKSFSNETFSGTIRLGTEDSDEDNIDFIISDCNKDKITLEIIFDRDDNDH